ncbi:rifampin ADP-ribosyl transferase [Rhodanobacter sp. FW510-R12]|uniref:segregation and condensation protein A n=1 Tax=unclassified Rhodanobacter TaxID=2621553 RepID=UPI0007A9DC11|nr:MULTISPECIES: ScpA family protein [unclassified Rhodanobacter]KZC15864.1 rifampin ADP-ribosyl transferase [Rhodanobacter sp. FW104-R8]KZC28468.1 rifampin ADP-ribosyl transferase [Rhodanobacter sp. FW510-T8]KZC32491.1 rifampin ADP-ribosyl transferase [Rhodanobacter sp. FW510-R10]
MSTEPVEPQSPDAVAQDAFASVPQQQEMPLAIVRGQPMLQMPQDLYIPPDALEVILEAFEGPLDLLLYLIRRQNLDILDIPVAEITRQYMAYIELMQDVMRLELAAEYLLMAAILAEIKSRLLLPRPPAEEGLEDDPRAELVRRLQEYERFKRAAEDIEALPRQERDSVVVHADVGERNVIKLPPPLDLPELLLALKDVMHRAELFGHHAIKREALSVRQRMGELLSRLDDSSFHRFESLFDVSEGRLGIVVTFLAMLELAKEMLVEIVQEEPLAPIYVKAKATASGHAAEEPADDASTGESALVESSGE